MNKSIFLTEPWVFFISNFILNNLVTFSQKDPPWMTPNLRDKINCKSCIYKGYIENGQTTIHYLQLQNAILKLSVAIYKGKDEYHSWLVQNLSDPVGQFWKKKINWKKVPIPLLLVNNELELVLKINAKHFNRFYDSKCAPLTNNYFPKLCFNK